MDTTKIADENDRELGVFIPIKYWEEIKKAIPGISQSIADQCLTDLVRSFSLFTLHAISQSILSGLKAYYGRNIIHAEVEPHQNREQIKEWEEKMNHIFALQRDIGILIAVSGWKKSLLPMPLF